VRRTFVVLVWFRITLTTSRAKITTINLCLSKLCLKHYWFHFFRTRCVCSEYSNVKLQLITAGCSKNYAKSVQLEWPFRVIINQKTVVHLHLSFTSIVMTAKWNTAPSVERLAANSTWGERWAYPYCHRISLAISRSHAEARYCLSRL